MGLFSTISSIGGSILNTVTGSASSAYNYVAPRVSSTVAPAVQTVQRTVQPVVSTVQQRVVQPVQTQVIQPVQQRVIQPAQRVVQQRVIQPVQTTIIRPAQTTISSGINLAPRVISAVAPVKTTILTAASISNPVTFGINLAPKVISPVATALKPASTKITTAFLTPMPQAQLSVGKSLKLDVLGGMRDLGGKTLSGASNVTQDILGIRQTRLKQGYAGLQATADVLNITGKQISAKFEADATESGWLQSNITKLNTFGAGIQRNATALNERISDFNDLPAVTSQAELDARIAKANEFQTEADLIGKQVGQYDAEGNRLNVWNQTMQGKYAENQALAAAYQNQTDAFNVTATQLAVEKQQVESTGLGAITGWFDRANKKVSGIWSSRFDFDASINRIKNSGLTGALSDPFNPMMGLVRYQTEKSIQKRTGFNAALGTEALAEYNIGQAKGLYEKPVTTAAWAGAGVAMGGAARAFPSLAAAAKAAPVIGPAITKIGSSGVYTVGSKVFPYAMGGMYALGTGIKVASQPKGTRARAFGETVSTELIPMTVGGMVGYNIPEYGSSLKTSLRAASQYTMKGIGGLKAGPVSPEVGSMKLTPALETITFKPEGVIREMPSGRTLIKPYQKPSAKVQQSIDSSREFIQDEKLREIFKVGSPYESKLEIPDSALWRIRNIAHRRSLTGQRIEAAIAFDKDWNALSMWQKGSPHSIRSRPPAETNAFFHTHPGGKTYFSDQDFLGARFKYEGVATPRGEIRVLEKPTLGWPDPEALKIKYPDYSEALLSVGIKQRYYGSPFQEVVGGRPISRVSSPKGVSAAEPKIEFLDPAEWGRPGGAQIEKPGPIEIGGSKLNLKDTGISPNLNIPPEKLYPVPITPEYKFVDPTQTTKKVFPSGRDIVPVYKFSEGKYTFRGITSSSSKGYHELVNVYEDLPTGRQWYKAVSGWSVPKPYDWNKIRTIAFIDDVAFTSTGSMKTGTKTIFDIRTRSATFDPRAPLELNLKGKRSPSVIAGLKEEIPEGIYLDITGSPSKSKPITSPLSTQLKGYVKERWGLGGKYKATPWLLKDAGRLTTADKFATNQASLKTGDVFITPKQESFSFSTVGFVGIGGIGSIGNIQISSAKQRESSVEIGVMGIRQLTPMPTREYDQGYVRIPKYITEGTGQPFPLKDLNIPTKGNRYEFDRYTPSNLMPTTIPTRDITIMNLQLPETGVSQFSIQNPRVDITDISIQTPKVDITTIQQPRLDITYRPQDITQIQQQQITTFDYPMQELVIPPPSLIVPPVNFPPLGGGGGGGYGGYGGRSGYEFTETMPLGDFLSDVFGGAGMDFGGLGSGRFAGFGSGNVRMKKPRKPKTSRKKKNK